MQENQRIKNAERVLRSLEDGFLQADKDGCIVMANEAIAMLCGYSSPETMIGLQVKALYADPDEREAVLKTIKEKGKLINCEMELKRKDGTRFWGLSNIKSIYDEKGNLLGTEGVVRDFTEIHNIKTDLEHANKVLASIRNVNQLITKERDPEKLLQGICSNLTKDHGYHNVWIMLLDDNGKFKSVYHAGLGKEFKQIEKKLQKGDFTDCAVKTLRQNDIVIINDPREQCSDCPLAELYENRGAMTAPIIYKDRLFGLITASIPREYLTQYDFDLFKEIADDTGLALHNLETAEKGRRLTEVVNSLPQPVSLVSSDYRYLAVNRVYADFYQTSVEEITGKNVSDFLGEDLFTNEVKPHLDRCLKGEIVEYELEAEFAVKGRLWMHMEYHPYYDENGRITGVMSHGYDITERKNIEKDLQDKAQLLNDTGEMARVGGWDVDPETQKLTWSEETYRIHEVPIEQTPPIEKAISFFHPDDRPILQEALKNAIEKGKPYDLILRFKTAKGKRLITHTICRPVVTNGKVTKLKGTFQDVTEWKKAEQNLQAANQQLNAANQQLAANEQQLRAANQQLIASEEELQAANQQLAANEQQLRAANQQLLANEQQLRAANQQLAASEKKIRSVMDKSPFPVAVVDVKDENIFYWSKSAKEMFGHVPETTKEWYELAYPDPKYRKEVLQRWKPFLERAQQSGKAENTGEYEIHCRDGSIKTCELYAQFIPDNLIVTLNDITERKKHERITNAKSKISQLILQKEDDALYAGVLDAVLHIMESKHGVFGYIDKEEALVCPSMTKDIWQECKMMDKTIVFPKDTWGDSIWGNGLRNKKGAYSNKQFTVPEGHLPVERFLTIPLVYQNESVGLISVGNKSSDYTDDDFNLLQEIADYLAPVIAVQYQRKQAEEKLLQLQELLKRTEKTGKIGGWEFNIKTMTQFWTEETFRIMEIETKNGEPKVPEGIEFIDQPYRDMAEKAIQDAIQKGKSYDQEWLITTAKGNKRWVHSVAIASKKNGEVVSVSGSFQDITERKQAEDALQKSRRDLQALISNSPICTKIIDLDFNLQYMSKAGIEQLKIDNIDEFYGKPYPLYFFPQTYKDEMSAKLHEIKKTGEILEIEGELADIQGNRLWYNHLLVPANDESGELDYILVVSMDITDRKKAEEDLKESEVMYRTLFDSVPIGLTVADKQGKIIESNNFAEALLGLSVEEQKKRQIDGKEWSIIRSDGSPFPKDEYASVRALKENKLIENVEMGIVKDSDNITWINVSAIPLPIEKLGVLIAYSDFTEKKQAQLALKKSEDFLNRTGEIARVGGWYLGDNFEKVYWTQTTGRIHELPDGYFPSLEEAFNYYHPDDQALVRDCVEAALNEGKPFNFETRLITAKGNQIWVQAIGQPEMKNGTCIRLSGIFQDITDRKKAEKQIEQDLLEKNNLIKELYHRTKNNMQVILSLLALKQRSIKSAEVKQLINDINNKIKSMALVHRKLYQSKDLSRIDLKDYIRDLTNELNYSFSNENKRITFKYDMPAIPILMDTAIPLGLLINELIANCFKHAWPDLEQGTIYITLKKQAGGTIILKLADDGIGLRQDFDLKKNKNFGLGTVEMIAKHQLNGNLTYKSENGLTWIVEFTDTLYSERV